MQKNNRAIVVGDVKKSFGKLVALNSLSFDVNYGDFFGLLGPNGAGKTTLLRVLAGILPVQHGRVYSGNEEVVLDRQQLRQSVGHMPEQVRWQGRKTVRQALL